MLSPRRSRPARICECDHANSLQAQQSETVKSQETSHAELIARMEWCEVIADEAEKMRRQRDEAFQSAKTHEHKVGPPRARQLSPDCYIAPTAPLSRARSKLFLPQHPGLELSLTRAGGDP